MDKIRIEHNTVQETLIIPLYGRKLCSEFYPELYNDPYAAWLCEHLDYDFSAIDQQARSPSYRFAVLESATRQIGMAAEVRDYLSEHPQGTIVNLGCGLDQTGRACDNGQARILNIDLPDIIEAREVLMPSGARERNLACDLNDLVWLDVIDPTQGVVLIAAGVFFYFTREQVRKIVCSVGERLPGSRIVFDSVRRILVRLMFATTLKAAGIEDVDGSFYLNHPERELAEWVPKAKVKSRGFMLGYHDLQTPGVSPAFRAVSRLADGPCKMRINSIDF